MPIGIAVTEYDANGAERGGKRGNQCHCSPFKVTIVRCLSPWASKKVARKSSFYEDTAVIDSELNPVLFDWSEFANKHLSLTSSCFRSDVKIVHNS